MNRRVCIPVMGAFLVAGCTTPGLTEQQAATAAVLDQGASIRPAAERHLEAGDKAAGEDFPGVALLCNSARPMALRRNLPAADMLRAKGRTPGRPVVPGKVFDDFYYLGVENVSAWALVTSDGIIVFDALNNAADWTGLVEPGMRALGLDPAMIRYVVVSHGHGDHFGGAAYLAEHYHARIMMSGPDWKLAPTMLDKPTFGHPPPQDLVIRDGQQLRLGGKTVTLHATPGHTLGTVSALVPVRDHGQPHVVALWGGTGFNFPHSRSRFHTYARSASRFGRLALADGADVPLANHPEIDMVHLKLAQLAAGAPGGPNPFVLGPEGVSRFFTALSECARGYAEQL